MSYSCRRWVIIINDKDKIEPVLTYKDEERSLNFFPSLTNDPIRFFDKKEAEEWIHIKIHPTHIADHLLTSAQGQRAKYLK